MPKTRTPSKRSANAFQHVAKAEAYVRGVVRGTIPVCEWVRRACRRHLADLKFSRTRHFRYRFDPELAERACRFAELFAHVKGHWAIPQPGNPAANLLRLEPWQCFIRASIYGWVEKATELRRFQAAYLEVPRKNSKSTMAALDGLQCFAADGEHGAEAYSGASTEKQAWEVFRPARLMAEGNRLFREHYGVKVNAKSLTILSNGSRFEPVIGKPGDGASPSIAIVDEYHEHPDSSLLDTMVTGMAARRQPLLLVITTAGEDLGGPCYAMHQQVERMLLGTEPNDRLFGLIYTIDSTDDWTSEEAIRKANPNYGVSVSPDRLRDQQREALADSRKQNVFKTKHLNVWVTARDPWMNMEWWNRQADLTLRSEAFTGEACYFGVDLSSKLDLTSVVRVFRKLVQEEAHYFCFGRHYCPRTRVEEPIHRQYQAWAAGGFLAATDAAGGERIDLDLVLGDLRADAKAQGCDQVAYDDWSAGTMEKELGAERITLVAIPQTTKHFSDAMKWTEALVKSGHFHHDGNPCLTWMVQNVTAREDPNGNLFPRKDRPENKIDGAVALLMAMGRAILEHQARSVYEDRGVRML